ncbi:hypothetical protein [Bradyrhizobium sp. RDI18]|uniref:hypothetical protein n=1 Tax=Bradyrhizobium sp. RDI18 TaxID=3367400 RepID=UPI0037198E0F
MSLISEFSIRKLPLKMWENMRHEIDPTIAAAVLLLMLLDRALADRSQHHPAAVEADSSGSASRDHDLNLHARGVAGDRKRSDFCPSRDGSRCLLMSGEVETMDSEMRFAALQHESASPHFHRTAGTRRPTLSAAFHGP